jgi:hypothetical protein
MTFVIPDRNENSQRFYLYPVESKWLTCRFVRGEDTIGAFKLELDDF